MARTNARQIEAALKRRADRTGIRWENFTPAVLDRVALSLESRVRIAGQLLRNSVVQNISRPVTKTSKRRTRDTTRFKRGGPKGSRYTVVSDRSKAGEFPKADTTRLLKDITAGPLAKSDVVTVSEGVFEAYVGTTLDYGVILETNVHLDRTFLTKTFSEMRGDVERILTGPLA